MTTEPDVLILTMPITEFCVRDVVCASQDRFAHAESCPIGIEELTMRPNQKRARLSVVPRTPAKTPAKSKVATAQSLPLNAPASTQGLLRDSYAATAFAEVLDRSLHAAMARFTVGVSPMTLIGAYADWARASFLFTGQTTAAHGKGGAEVVAAGDLREPHRASPVMAASPASSRCRRISVSSGKRGGNPRTT